MRGRSVVLPILILLFFSAVMLTPAVFYLVVRQTGQRAQATVGDCVTTGSGRSMNTHCTGTWIVGGSLLDGGHVIYGTISGVDESDMGKDVDVALFGDAAYSRSLTLPFVLLGFGIAPIGIAGLLVFERNRKKRSA